MTNTTNLAVQTMPQTQAANSTPKAPASTQSSKKSFQKVMQETAQQAQQSASSEQPQTNQAQQKQAAETPVQPQQKSMVRMLNAQQDTDTTDVKASMSGAEIFEMLSGISTEQSGQKNQGISGVRVLGALSGVELGESFTDVKANFLSMLFGGTAVEGVDMEQSDMEILKDVYKNLTDPAAQFAMMLLMAFMQDNPEVSMMDVAGTLDQAAWSNPDVSPVQKVFTAISKMQMKDESLKSSDMLDTLMQMAREMKIPASIAKFKGELPELSELEMLLMPKTAEKQQTTVQNTARNIVQDPAVVLQQGQAQFKDAVTQARQMMQNTTTANSTPVASNPSAAQSNEAQATGGTGQKRESGVAIDVEKLQEQVNANSYMQNTSHQVYQLRQAGAVVTDQPEIDPMELINQVRTGILSGADKGENEFVLKLRPEGLGELTIHLLENGGKMTLSIVASNAQTQKLLTSELANLQAAMKPLNVEVQPVTTSQQASSSSMEQSLSGQMAQQQFGEHNHGEQFDAPTRMFHPLTDEATEQELQAAGYANSIGTSALDTYI